VSKSTIYGKVIFTCHSPSRAYSCFDDVYERIIGGERGWFHSKNSVRHITICEFKAMEKGIEKIKRQINKTVIRGQFGLPK
jgi:hypothetical protein